MFKFWRSLQSHRLFITSFCVVLSLVGVTYLAHPAYTLGDQTLAELTNAERTSQGLAPLSWNATLSQAAWLKAQDMCTQGYWAHTAPNGATGWTFMTQAGYKYTVAGENLARDYASDSETVAAWMASPGHRANILKPTYADIGIASSVCTIDGSPTKLVVALYGATSSSPKAAVAQTAKTTPVAKPVQTQSAPVAQPAVVASASVPTKANETSVGSKLWELLRSMYDAPLFKQLVAAPFSEPRAVAYLHQ
jgi:hypothetical protein